MYLGSIIDYIKQYPLLFVGIVGSIVLGTLTYLNTLKLPVLEEEHAHLLRQKAVLDFNLLNSQGLDKDIKHLKELKENIASRLMDPSERAHIFHYFFQLEDESGVKIENPRQVKVVDFSKAFPSKIKIDGFDLALTEYKLEATGTYPQVLDFINNLQSSHYIAKIKQFSLKPSKALEANTLTITLNIDFFGKRD